MSTYTYRSRAYVPPLVQRAIELAQRHGFEHSCIPEVGRLLGVLASHVQHGIVGEIGTGAGVGAAWMLSHMASTSRFVTVEADAERATAAENLFRDQPKAQVIHGDWREILAHGPFDLLFVDAGAAKAAPNASTAGLEAAAETILRVLRPGGMVVMDDLGPEEYWPEEWRGRPDPVREFWLNDTCLTATEVLTTPRTMAILATRIS
jgi:predicted O-methyltransferase YrrM